MTAPLTATVREVLRAYTRKHGLAATLQLIADLVSDAPDAQEALR